MKQLRRLTPVTLQMATRKKEDNGATTVSYSDVASYNVIQQEITDDVSASIYGANIIKMKRLTSPRLTLEKFLNGCNNDGSDNLSYYYIVIGDKRYKITAVYTNWIDVEFIETVRTISL